MSTSPAPGVVVVGAGPYGLAAAAHLRRRGVRAHVLGDAMSFWRRMPEGMRLRSSWAASSIRDPDGALTLDAFQSERGTEVPRPIPLEDFVAYALWYQRRAVPDLDARRVVRVEREGGGFGLDLDDGDRLRASRVVVATGLESLDRRPPQLDGLRAPLVHHASELQRLDGFAGARTVVLGAGQSAIELAALLAESGARVEVIARAPQVHWLGRSQWLHERSRALRAMLYPPTDVGPLGLSWVVAAPALFRRLPPRTAERVAARCIRPAASGWLRPRTATVTITTGRRVVVAAPGGDGLELRLDDGSARTVDRVVLATGYDVRLRRDWILPPELVAAVRTRGGAPVLGTGLESSVPGLHFLGAYAAATFGPVMRFVSGTGLAGRALAAHVARTPGRRLAAARPAPAPA